MNIKTILPEEYVNFVASTKKQNKYFKIIIISFVIISLFLIFLLIKYLNEYHLFSATII